MGEFLRSIFKLEVHASLRAEPVGSLGPVTITNSMLMAWAAMIVLIVFAYFAGRRPQLVPSGVQNVFEAILDALLTIVENTAGHYARTVFPLIATLFIYIITANYMGLLPGVGTILIRNPAIGHEAQVTAGATAHLGEPGRQPAQAAAGQAAHQAEAKSEPEFVPLLRSANADVNMTFAMGIIAFIFIHASGFLVHGFRGYFKNELANPPMLMPVKLIIESFVPVSLSMRLFGNIFGGEMLMTVMGFPLVAVPFMVMELLFGFIQATIFSMLTLVFVSLATHLPHGHEPEGEHAEREEDGDRSHPAGQVRLTQ
jgi:F-type H+-transporting ATPase subunit a